MSTIALDVVARSCFGLFFNDDQKALISELVNAALMRSIRKLGPSALLQSVPTPANRRFDWMMRTVDEWIYEHIRQRRVSPGEHQDLLTLMLNGGRTNVRLTDRQLRDEIWTVMMTGHETTAISLVWTLMLIAKHPEVEQRLSQEMSAVIGKDVPKFDHLCRMPYLRDVIRESMRLYPTGWMVGRRAVREQHLGGVRIPIDTMVLMSQWFMHRDERWFSDPLTFDPDRWSDGLMQRLPKFVYFPFGGGPHLCIGDQFALMEIAMVLATILPRFKLSMASSQEPVLVPKLTLRPKNGMPMELEERT
jgi:cytochrome P450